MTVPYGVPGYPPPGHSPYGPPPTVTRSANPFGIVITLVGGALALVGAFVHWYSGPVSLSDIVRVLDTPGAKAFPKAYFGWLMWVVLGVTVVAALFANAAVPVSTALRIVSPIAGVLGAVLVCTSLGQLIQGQSIFAHAAAGLWLVLLGFVVAGLGGVLGPRRAQRPGPY